MGESFQNERFNQIKFRVWCVSNAPSLRLPKCRKSSSIVILKSRSSSDCDFRKFLSLNRPVWR
ncbi:hypothetical protein E1A91_D01G270500v1 [Gossypium mustelinum]|uniref:Uncharacterized protein n=1 Tax=Gossypium mustelinum TaxID=34275 RepID=A0A5D2WCM2_GOSMU|nr:hypothetical protein E1A91_D01G270500v1 [Gossypium mustelinum]